MATLVVYESVYGNTQKIAVSIAKGLGTEAVEVGKMTQEKLANVSLLIIGCPTYGGRPTEGMKRWLETITVKGLKVATFDTRMNMWIAKLFGYAADKMAENLEHKGATILSKMGFFVAGKEGPVTDGEIERAEKWAGGLVN